MQQLQLESQVRICAGLKGLYALAAKYEHKLNEDRAPLDQIISSSFAVLGSLVNSIVSKEENADNLQILYLIVKVFGKYNSLQMSPYLMEESALEPWI